MKAAETWQVAMAPVVRGLVGQTEAESLVAGLPKTCQVFEGLVPAKEASLGRVG